MAKSNKTLATKRTDIFSVDPRNIVVVEGFNLRKEMGDIESLSNSIVERGLEVPLICSKVRGTETWELVDGHRRLEAIKLAISKGADIPYVTVTSFKGNAESRLLTMLVTGATQKNLTDLELAEGIQKLVNFEYKVEEIAQKVGKSIPQVYNLLQFANAPKSVKNRVEEGKITVNTVVLIMKEEKNPERIIDMVNSAIEDAEGQVDSKGKAKKATAKNVRTLKSKSASQKMKEILETLNNDEAKKDTDKVKFLTEFIGALKGQSVEEILEGMF